MSSLKRILSKLLGLNGFEKLMTPNNVILITGCDSGLGYSLANYCHNLNMTVVSACHNIQSVGAKQLQQLDDTKRMFTIELDLLNSNTIDEVHKYIDELLNINSQYQFTALVNNAGVMCFGEFEWQTERQFEMQINVNLLGTMKLTNKFLPLIRKHSARIINITSHCGLQALPSVSAYAASKAGLRFWNDSLRIEMSQYNVAVINFIPGSFVLSSNISARQQEHAKVMYNEFSDEQKQFYGKYFTTFNEYLKFISGFKPPNKLNDDELLIKFHHALTNNQPKDLYIHEPLRYKIYRILFSICPTVITDWLTVQFCALPTYQQVNAIKN